MKCKECSAEISLNYMESSKTRMIERKLCFICLFWSNYVDCVEFGTIATQRIARINHKHFVIGNEGKSRRAEFRGYGGAKFVIIFNNGDRVETTNLWAQGEIPERFRNRLPDNAKFEEE